jgi:hypothetical protein
VLSQVLHHVYMQKYIDATVMQQLHDIYTDAIHGADVLHNCVSSHEEARQSCARDRLDVLHMCMSLHALASAFMVWGVSTHTSMLSSSPRVYAEVRWYTSDAATP